VGTVSLRVSKPRNPCSPRSHCRRPNPGFRSKPVLGIAGRRARQSEVLQFVCLSSKRTRSASSAGWASKTARQAVMARPGGGPARRSGIGGARRNDMSPGRAALGRAAGSWREEAVLWTPVAVSALQRWEEGLWLVQRTQSMKSQTALGSPAVDGSYLQTETCTLQGMSSVNFWMVRNFWMICRLLGDPAPCSPP